MTDETNQSIRLSLRTELGAVSDPDFTFMLPPHWVRRAVDQESEADLVAAMRQRLMSAHRPDLYARMRAMASEAFSQMRKVSTIAMFSPAEDAPETAVLPASLTATIRHAEPGETLDAYVRDAIVNDGAVPLFGDKRILRVERETRQELDGSQINTTTVVYLSPVPGTARRKALLLSLVVLRPDEIPLDDPAYVRIKTLFDVCISSLMWLPAE